VDHDDFLMGTPYAPKWFRIDPAAQVDEHAGQLHISGWFGCAIKGEALSPRSDGWLSYSICPVCHAMVVADKHNPAHGDHTWAHERWHARNDFPVPADLLTDADRKAGYGPNEGGLA
jgi:hypothetical protein